MSKSKTFSVLANRSAEDVHRDPFAYTVVDGVFGDALYQRLADSFPPVESFVEGLDEVKNNQAVRIPAAQVLGNPQFSEEWREFFSYHTSQAFWGDIVRVFGDRLRATYPDLEARIGRPLEAWRTKRRGEDGAAEVDLDLLFVINTPVEKESSVRPPHVDNERKIFSGLFYMRPDGDETPGGDLAIYRARRGNLKFGGHYVENRAIEQTDLIGYAANRFIGFVNGAESVHGVTPRPKTDRVRRYINFVAELPFPIFALEKLPWHRKKLFRLTRKDKAAGVTLGYGAEAD